jgi:hypothetical protein
MMDLSTEITQLKRIHSDLLDLLDQLVRKEMKLVQEKRALQSQKELLTRAPQPPRPVPTHPMWVRVNQICKTPSNPNGILPISRSTWFKGVKEGRFPQPTKFGRTTLWKLSDVIALVENAE